MIYKKRAEFTCYKATDVLGLMSDVEMSASTVYPKVGRLTEKRKGVLLSVYQDGVMMFRVCFTSHKAFSSFSKEYASFKILLINPPLAHKVRRLNNCVEVRGTHLLQAQVKICEGRTGMSLVM